MAFDRIDFFRVCMDMEKYLGYLRGNELVVEYLQTLQDSQPPMPELYVEHSVSLRGWETPCPDGQWKVSFNGMGPLPIVWMPFDATEEEKDKVDSEVKANLTTAYNNGLNWADGMAMYMNEICAQFSHVDVEAMANAVLDLSTNVIEELDLGARDQWTEIGSYLTSWQGGAATQFFLFHNSYGSALSQFAVMSGQIGGGFAAATAMIHGTQEAAMKFAESARESLEVMLAFWVEVGLRTPPDPNFDIDVPKILKIAEDVWTLARLIPPVKAATEGINVAVDAVKAITSLVGTIAGGGGTPELHVEPYRFKDWSANGLYSGVTTQFHDEIYVKYVEAMDQLHAPTGGADPSDPGNVPFSARSIENHMLELQGDRNEWELAAVPPENLNGGNAPYPLG